MEQGARKVEKSLQHVFESGTIVIKDGWAICPVCGKGKLIKLLPTTTVHDLPCKCKRCGQETKLNIEAPEPVSTMTSA